MITTTIRKLLKIRTMIRHLVQEEKQLVETAKAELDDQNMSRPSPIATKRAAVLPAPKPTERKRRVKISPAKKAKIARLRTAGLSAATIAARLKVSVPSVYAVKKSG